MTGTTENPNDPDSFPYLLRQIIGGVKGDQARAAKNLELVLSYFLDVLNGYRVPKQETAEKWLKKLQKYYDLDRPFEGTGHTLMEAYEKRIQNLKEPNPAPEKESVSKYGFKDGRSKLLWAISGKRKNFKETISEGTGISYSSLGTFLVQPELSTLRWVEGTLIPKLLEVFPDQKENIEELKRISSVPLTSTAKIKGAVKENIKQVEADFKLAAGMLLREMREINGYKIADVAAQIRAPRILSNNPIILEKIESGSVDVAKTIYCDAITEICVIFKRTNPEKSAPYIAQLMPISKQLRPR